MADSVRERFTDIAAHALFWIKENDAEGPSAYTAHFEKMGEPCVQVFTIEDLAGVQYYWPLVLEQLVSTFGKQIPGDVVNASLKYHAHAYRELARDDKSYPRSHDTEMVTSITEITAVNPTMSVIDMKYSYLKKTGKHYQTIYATELHNGEARVRGAWLDRGFQGWRERLVLGTDMELDGLLLAQYVFYPPPVILLDSNPAVAIVPGDLSENPAI